MQDRNTTLGIISGIPVSPDQLAALGGGQVAYVRTIQSEQVQTMFPQAPMMPPGQKLYLLMAADGSPLMLSDSRDMAIAGAKQNELVTVGLH